MIIRKYTIRYLLGYDWHKEQLPIYLQIVSIEKILWLLHFINSVLGHSTHSIFKEWCEILLLDVHWCQVGLIQCLWCSASITNTRRYWRYCHIYCWLKDGIITRCRNDVSVNIISYNDVIGTVVLLLLFDMDWMLVSICPMVFTHDVCGAVMSVWLSLLFTPVCLGSTIPGCCLC